MFETKTVSFIKTGYDPFIDFIKAYAIICVLIGHTLPHHNYWGYGLWAGMQVPLFILVQAFHCFKKKHYSFSIKKVLWRVIIPFIGIQVILFAVFLHRDNSTIVNTLKSFVISGGKGPGSYYPWVYLQIALLLPFVKRLLNKGSVMQNGLVFLIVCELFEIIASITNIPDYIYRLLAIRYLFLMYFAWIWVNKGVTSNRKTIILSVFSLLTIIYFEYLSINDEILFYNTSWKYHRWPCYCFVAMGGIILLRCLYDKLFNKAIANKIIKILAKCSYEIFLTQMVIIPLYPDNLMISLLQSIGISDPVVTVVSIAIKVIIIFTLSLLIGFYFNKCYNRLMPQQIK